MKKHKLVLKKTNESKSHSQRHECEPLLQYAEDDSARTGDTLMSVRHLAFACALFHTYPETLREDMEQSFLNIFWTRMHAEHPEASAEDIEWARNLLHHMRDHGFSDEQMDVIAEIASLELLDSEDASCQ